MIEKFMTK